MAVTYHKDLTGADLHPPGYIQSTDPGAVGGGILWVDTTDPNDLVLRVRNDANDAWLLVGDEGLVFQGAWSSATEYFEGDVVEHNGSAYVANTQHTNSEPPSVNWDVLAEKGDQGATGPAGADGEDGPIWRGDWVNTTSYAVDDAVHHNGSAYIATSANTGSEPPSADWDLMAAQGDGLGTHQAAGVADHDDVDLTGIAENDSWIRNASGIFVRKPYATQAQAEAGTAEGVWVSPLRVKQAIDALGGGGSGFWEPLASETTAAATRNIDFTGLATSHRLYRVRGKLFVEADDNRVGLRLNGDTGSNYGFQRVVEYYDTTTVRRDATTTSICEVAFSGYSSPGFVFDFIVHKPSTTEPALLTGVTLFRQDGVEDAVGRQTVIARWNNTADLVDQVSIILLGVDDFEIGSYVQILGFVES